jgi:hypothetical protein
MSSANRRHCGRRIMAASCRICDRCSGKGTLIRHLPHKSGGRPPAVVVTAFQERRALARRGCYRESRAASVSPPWSLPHPKSGRRPPAVVVTASQERRALARRSLLPHLKSGGR